MPGTDFRYLAVRESDSGAESLASGEILDSEKDMHETMKELELLFPEATFIHLSKIKKNVCVSRV
jgi:hypothetical protein